MPSDLRLGYASAADVIEMKGRVACEISSGDELLLTELIFNGAFNDLSVEQAVALLSCFVNEEKVSLYFALTHVLIRPPFCWVVVISSSASVPY